MFISKDLSQWQKVFENIELSKLFKKIQKSAEVKISIVHAKHFHFRKMKAKVSDTRTVGGWWGEEDEVEEERKDRTTEC